MTYQNQSNNQPTYTPSAVLLAANQHVYRMRDEYRRYGRVVRPRSITSNYEQPEAVIGAADLVSIAAHRAERTGQEVAA